MKIQQMPTRNLAKPQRYRWFARLICFIHRHNEKLYNPERGIASPRICLRCGKFWPGVWWPGGAPPRGGGGRKKAA